MSVTNYGQALCGCAGRNQPAMPPGRELDAEVATLVLQRDVRWLTNWRSDMEPHYLGTNLTGYVPLPHYSTSWDAMRLVVERMVALRYDVESIVDDEGASVIVAPRVEGRDGRGTAATLPHAVCLAALAAFKAVEADRA